MKSEKEAIALICARGGSKGLPGKNIKLFAGKPLIAWAIEHALAIPRIKRTIVSTDSKEIAKVARGFGAEVPFLRPQELAGDDSPEWLAWRHALQFIREAGGVYPDILVCVPCTAPLRFPMDIESCLDKLEETDADMVITVTDAHRSPYFNMVKKKSDNSVCLVMHNEEAIVRRQDVPVVYDMTTVAYAARPEFIIKHDSMFEGLVRAVHVPPERALDIDTHLDFEIAEFLMHKRQDHFVND